MQQNYVVFENVEELNKDEELDHPPALTAILGSEKNGNNYIGNHRILWVKDQTIILTLGPHCNF